MAKATPEELASALRQNLRKRKRPSGDAATGGGDKKKPDFKDKTENTPQFVFPANEWK